MPRDRRSRSRSRDRDRDRQHRDHRRDHESSSSRHHQRDEQRRPVKSEPVKSEPRSSDRQRDSGQTSSSQMPFKPGDIKWGKPTEEAKTADNGPKEKPNFETSGKLLEDTNMFRGRIIKYNEPPEAMKPRKRWRFYPFKGEEALPVMYVHRQSAYLIGSDRLVADFPVDHPSCSKQHAVLQYRLVPHVKPDGAHVRVVRPYIIDLESTNGTYLNAQRVEPRRYYEIKEKDVLKFGFSSREYVMLHEKSDTTEDDDEQPPETAEQEGTD